MIRCIIVCTYENVNISLNLDVIEGWVKAAIRQSCGTSVLHTGRQRLGMLIDQGDAFCLSWCPLIPVNVLKNMHSTPLPH
jgi:hypothetical protein